MNTSFEQVERLWNLGLRAHFCWIERSESNKQRWTDGILSNRTGNAVDHIISSRKDAVADLEAAKARGAVARAARLTLAHADLKDST